MEFSLINTFTYSLIENFNAMAHGEELLQTTPNCTPWKLAVFRRKPFDYFQARVCAMDAVWEIIVTGNAETEGRNISMDDGDRK